MSMRKREKVQEVLRDEFVATGRRGERAAGRPPWPPIRPFAVVAAAVWAVAAQAAVWPDQFAGYQRTATTNVEVSDRPVWDEYGLEVAERATYELGKTSFTATAYRLKDPTGALAAYQWLQPKDAAPSKIGDHAVETADSVLLGLGNYILQFTGYKPKPEEIQSLVLPRLDQSALPALAGYLPPDHRIPGSERYIVGPVSLEKFEPRVPPSVAAFRLGAEGQAGRYRAKGGDMQLTIFSYPTPDLARDRKADFERLPGALVKRTGPMVAVVFSPPDPDEAERLLAKIEYQPALTMSEYVPTRRDNIGNLILNIFQLTGILLLFAAVAGLAFGGLRVLSRRFGSKDADEPMITLHLSDR